MAHVWQSPDDTATENHYSAPPVDENTWLSDSADNTSSSTSSLDQPTSSSDATTTTTSKIENEETVDDEAEEDEIVSLENASPAAAETEELLVNEDNVEETQPATASAVAEYEGDAADLCEVDP